jgi:hypothetical protein
MIIILFLGLFALIAVSCLICVLCCVLCGSENQNISNFNDAAKSALKGMAVGRDNENAKKVEECIICMDKFSEDERELV